MSPWFTVQSDSLTVFINAESVMANCKASERTKEKYIATALRLREVYPEDDFEPPELEDEYDDEWETDIDPKSTVH